MAERREYLGDEVHMMTSDIAILRNENELLKLTSERRTEENRILREELTALRAKYEEKVADASALYTILSSTAQGIHHGLERYLERRTLKKETLANGAARQEPEQPKRPEPNAALRAKQREYDPQPMKPLAEQPRVAPTPSRVPVARTPEPVEDPPPAFLQRPGGPVIRHDIVDPRIPGNELVSDEDELRAQANSIGSSRRDKA